MLGIEDPLVVLAYLLCLVSTGVCVIYAWQNWNRGDDAVEEEDRRWAAGEDEAKEKI